MQNVLESVNVGADVDVGEYHLFIHTHTLTLLSPDDYSKKESHQLEPSFMYSQLIKEILFDIEYNQNFKEQLVQLWRHYILIDNLI